MKPYKKIVSTAELPYDEWLRYRRMGIGGSDAGAVLGFNKYKGAFVVYQEKVHGYRDDLSEKESVYWGNVLEPVIIKEFEKKTGKRVHRVNAMLQSVQHPFMVANLDGKIVNENALLECKTTSAFLDSEWKEDEIPPQYICQCQHYMAVTGAERTYIACLIGGQHFIDKTIERDEEFIEWMIEQEYEFWKAVEDRRPPLADGTGATSKFLDTTYQSGGGKVQVPKDIAEAMMVVDLENGRIKALEKSVQENKNRIKAFLKGSEVGISERYTAIWKPITTKRADVQKLKKEYPEIYKECLKETTTRKFEIKEREQWQQ